MTNARADISLMQIADEIYEKNYEKKNSQLISTQNISVCQIDEENDENDINKKFINSDNCDFLNVLAALMNTRSKAAAKAKDKNKQIIQEHVKKEKQYVASRAIQSGEYVDAPRRLNSSHIQVEEVSETSQSTQILI